MDAIKKQTQKLNVLFCNHQSNDKFIGGAEFLLLNIAKNIDRNKFNPFFLSISDGKVNELVVEAGIQSSIISYDMFWELWLPGKKVESKYNSFIEDQVQNIQTIAHYIEKNQIKIVISNCMINVVPLIAAKKVGIPTIWFINEIFRPFDCMDTKLKRMVKSFRFFNKLNQNKMDQFIKDQILKYADKTIFLSHKARGRIFSADEFEEKAIVMNPALRKEIFDSAVKETANFNGIKKNSLSVAFLGILVKHKGGHDFVEMAAKVARKTNNLHFTVAGGTTDSKYQQYLKKRVKQLKIENILNFTGFLKNPVTIYKKADIVCMLSLYDEPFGMVVTEGMAFGKTVIAYDTGSIREIINDGKTGFVIPRGNKRELVKKILFLGKNREAMKKIGKNARIMALEKYNPAHYVKKIEKLLAELNPDG